MTPKQFCALGLVLGLLTSGCGRVAKADAERVMCRTLAGDRTAIHMHKWKFEPLRSAVLELLSEHKPVTWAQMERQIPKHMAPGLLDSVENLHDDLEAVVLELEVRGEVLRRTDEKEPKFVINNP